MKPSKYIFIISLHILLLIPSFIYAELDLSTPEGTLEVYISALKTGNKQLVLRCYKTDDFYLPSAVIIDKYWIIDRVAFMREMAEKYEAIPKAQEGDVQLDVIEIIDGKEGKYSYLFRKYDDGWYIIAHSAWGLDT
jgi:hypothetical protein